MSTVDALLRAPMPPSVSFLPRTTCPRAAALGRCRNTRTAGGEDDDDDNDDLDDESEDAGGARKVAAVTFINHRPRHLSPLPSLSLSPSLSVYIHLRPYESIVVGHDSSLKCKSFLWEYS